MPPKAVYGQSQVLKAARNKLHCLSRTGPLWRARFFRRRSWCRTASDSRCAFDRVPQLPGNTAHRL